MKFRFFPLVILLLVALLACKQTESNPGGGPPPIGKHMQMVHFKQKSLTDDAVLDSKDLAGKVLLINFFASWCPPCIQEIPSLVELQKDYQSKGFSVVAFSFDDVNTKPVLDLIEKYGINYPILKADTDVAKGFGGVVGIPVSFLVNRKGEIVKKFLGYVEHNVLEQEIKTMLAEG